MLIWGYKHSMIGFLFTVLSNVFGYFLSSPNRAKKLLYPCFIEQESPRVKMKNSHLSNSMIFI